MAQLNEADVQARNLQAEEIVDLADRAEAEIEKLHEVLRQLRVDARNYQSSVRAAHPTGHVITTPPDEVQLQSNIASLRQKVQPSQAENLSRSLLSSVFKLAVHRFAKVQTELNAMITAVGPISAAQQDPPEVVQPSLDPSLAENVLPHA